MGSGGVVVGRVAEAVAGVKCRNHTAEAVEGRTLCRLCLLRMRVRYQRRALPVVKRVCLRCGRVSKQGRKCVGKFCWSCRRVLRRNPDAEIRGRRIA